MGLIWSIEFQIFWTLTFAIADDAEDFKSKTGGFTQHYADHTLNKLTSNDKITRVI